ncbi:winged helix DNA-binding domain-containing protein [Nocardioides sp. 1609]|uniref:winged helix DNA-binding domain-containing protein n=1 Tax=Nocardioides sp. 1609 TaxID=2508327 RepID=UPI00106F639D|nr:winged helix DNA-binding domain-containing protein [Nocardioides sp. 1609]
MRLSPRTLNRTLLRRQHLLERTDASVVDESRHLLGLQAQENLPPFLSLAARLSSFDPDDVTRGLEDRTLVRLLTMRGTVHLLAADDIGLRAFTATVHEREIRSSQNVGPARDVDRTAFLAALDEVLADGPLPQRAIGAALAERFPAYPATRLGQLARSAAPLVQLPPRGTWRGVGGVVYDRADRWTGRPLDAPATENVVRRYLRAFGPATAADLTAWSAVTRLGPVVRAMTDLVVHEDEDGRTLYDVEGAPIAAADEPAPVRLLGTYDNLWLSHARRDRVTAPGARDAWSGVNGASAMTLFVDGWLTGLWHVAEGRVVVLETLRDLTRAERAELAEESARVEALLASR